MMNFLALLQFVHAFNTDSFQLATPQVSPLKYHSSASGLSILFSQYFQLIAAPFPMKFLTCS